MQPTADPHVMIEEQRPGYVRYRNGDGRRWEVHGYCDRRGDCLIGMRIEGFGIITNHDEIAAARRALGRERIDSWMDVPVTPEFDDCCGHPVTGTLRFVELEPA